MFFTIVLLLLVLFAALVFGQAIGAAIGERIWPGSGSFAQRCAYCPARNRAQPKDYRPHELPPYQPVYVQPAPYYQPEPYYAERPERPYDAQYDANVPTMPVQRKVPAQRRKQLPKTRRSAHYPVRRQVQRR